jgi:ATP phosphoribosyltransferase regulatory subunit
MTLLALKIEVFLKAYKCEMPEIGLLQPADPILNAAGEDIRRRIFMSSDLHGRDLCLRPEFTIPVCLHHLEKGTSRKRYGYHGKVFRQRQNEQVEFLQAGIEDIGAKNRTAADARSLLEAVEMLRTLGKGRLSITIGDQAIFEAVLKSLGLPKSWRERLGRAFGDPVRMAADLERLSGKNGDPLAHLPQALARAIANADRDGVTDLVAKKIQSDGLATQSGRSAEEIAKRMLEKAELATARLPDEKREVLEAFLKLDLSIANANAKLWAFARRTRIPLGDGLEAFHKRCRAIEKLKLENVSVRYKAGFGRQLDYYTGFVFEIRSPGKAGAKPLAGGGRYDHLLTLLGSKTDIPAIGFAIFPDRFTVKIGKASAR